MKVEKKIEKKGYKLRGNMGYRNGIQTIVNFSAMKNGKEFAKASSKTALLKQL